MERLAAIFLMAARPLHTGIVQQALADVLPDRALTLKADIGPQRTSVDGMALRHGRNRPSG